jgi:hypothetical protein
MADRNPSFFGPVLPQAPDAPEAFSFDELQRVRGRRIEADLLRTRGTAWPAQRRFKTMYPFSVLPDGTHVVRFAGGVERERGLDS